jgi:hypothetical protein
MTIPILLRLLQGITCHYSDAVLELIRCMKRRLPALMPGGESQLSEDDKDWSQGLTKFLQSYDFDVYPGLVSSLLLFVDVWPMFWLTLSYTNLVPHFLLSHNHEYLQSLLHFSS